MGFRVLDAFCCQGSASAGLKRALPDANITGVDISPQPLYQFDFVQANALDYLVEHAREYDFIWASPPCQGYTWAAWGVQHKYETLVEPVRDVLNRSGKPYIIENVVGAPLFWQVELCGMMFDLKVFRHRRFESNFGIKQPAHLAHVAKIGYGDDDFVSVAGHGSNGSAKLERWKEAMGIDWMDRYGLTQAIPPAYAEYLGKFIPR